MSFSVQFPIYQEINQSAHRSVHHSIKTSLYVDSVVTVNQSTYRCIYRSVLGALERIIFAKNTLQAVRKHPLDGLFTLTLTEYASNNCMCHVAQITRMYEHAYAWNV